MTRIAPDPIQEEDEAVMGTKRRTSRNNAVVKLKRELDTTDLKVLDLLQRDGRLANKDLARMVQLSPTPCLRRVSQLKEAGYIRGYRAVLDPAMLGFTLRAFPTLKRSRDSNREELTEQILVIPEVQACHVVSGEYDLLVELLARDMDDYARIAIGHISEIPGIYDLRSTFSIVPLKTLGELPILKRTR
jgi:Lrp/AsnC family transcriptional regulator, leucine-responsive regulatory protein